MSNAKKSFDSFLTKPEQLASHVINLSHDKLFYTHTPCRGGGEGVETTLCLYFLNLLH